MGTWKNVAVIQIDQTLIVQEVPDVHLPVDQHQVDLQMVVHLPVDQHQVDLQMVVHLHDLVPLIHLAVQLDLILQGLHHDHQDQIQVDVAKIYLREVVLHHDQVHQVEIAKVAM